MAKEETSTYCKTKIDISSFPKLKHLSLEWRKGVTGLFDSETLEEIFLLRYPGDSLTEFLAMKPQKNLDLSGPRVKEVGSYGGAPLTRLRMRAGRRFGSFSGIEAITSLREIWIQSCRKVVNVEPIAELKDLVEFFITDNGDIESLLPVLSCKRLRKLLFYGNTKVLDGNIRALTQLPLDQVSFANRRHYDITREEFRALLQP